PIICVNNQVCFWDEVAGEGTPVHYKSLRAQRLLRESNAPDQGLKSRVAPQWIPCGIYFERVHNIGMPGIGFIEPGQSFVLFTHAHVCPCKCRWIHGIATV